MVKRTQSKRDGIELQGPIWNELSKEEIVEVVIDGFDGVYFSNSKTGITKEDIFKTREELDIFISEMLDYKKLPASELSYYFQLNNNLKVNIVLPPKAINTPSIVITKIPKEKVSLDDYVSWKVINEEEKKLIEKILHSDKGILLAGNMGAGKKTLLNTIIRSIPHPRRIVTIERVPDLMVERPLLTRLQTKNQKAQEVIELIDLAERMRADYLVLTDCVGPEMACYVEMVRNNTSAIALTTGENIIDAVKRLVTKVVISSEGLSIEEANYAIAQVFPYVIFQERKEDGRRVISTIAELKFINGEIKVEKMKA